MAEQRDQPARRAETDNPKEPPPHATASGAPPPQPGFVPDPTLELNQAAAEAADEQGDYLWVVTGRRDDRTVLWERDPAHPVNEVGLREVFIGGQGQPPQRVGNTPAVMGKLHSHELLEVPAEHAQALHKALAAVGEAPADQKVREQQQARREAWTKFARSVRQAPPNPEVRRQAQPGDVAGSELTNPPTGVGRR